MELVEPQSLGLAARSRHEGIQGLLRPHPLRKHEDDILDPEKLGELRGQRQRSAALRPGSRRARSADCGTCSPPGRGAHGRRRRQSGQLHPIGGVSGELLARASAGGSSDPASRWRSAQASPAVQPGRAPGNPYSRGARPPGRAAPLCSHEYRKPQRERCTHVVFAHASATGPTTLAQPVGAPAEAFAKKTAVPLEFRGSLPIISTRQGRVLTPRSCLFSQSNQ